ncbi:hypothetical protein [Microbacterium sp.]|jgi:hypothetical protein|uniref:hypothetical protein n=1 Tax=Microbacterium sp. TaxID=51671 RepID=UPI0037CA4ACA
MIRRSLLVLVGVGILSAGLLAGCATGATSSPAPGEADPSTSDVPAEVHAAWLDGGRGIAVVTRGSSSCVPTAGEPVLEGETLTVDLVDTADGACTRDMAPRATYVALPSGVDPTKNLDVVVTGAVAGSASLAGLAAVPAPVAEFAPSAGWAGESLAAILTWGSSGCRPQVEAVTSTEGGVVVTFADPPADQVCTMDLAPRVTLVDLAGIAGEEAVELTLSGGNIASDGPVPLLGR